jgi:hypothetical protein
LLGALPNTPKNYVTNKTNKKKKEKIKGKNHVTVEIK